jgi:hypothetical protein
MSSTPSRWRALVTSAVAGLVVAAAVLGPPALASGSDSPSRQASRAHSASEQASRGRAASALAGAKKAHAADASCTTSAVGAKAPDPGPGLGPFLDAVAQLKQAGTITDAQARAIDADIQAGSIDPQQLVASGTLTAAQMQVVNDRLVAVKRGLAAANGDSGATAPAQAKPPKG